MIFTRFNKKTVTNYFHQANREKDNTKITTKINKNKIKVK